MKQFALATAVVLSAPLALWADGCPTAPDHTEQLDRFYDALQTARNDAEGRVISNQMWQLWLDAPDEPSQTMLDRGMAARGVADFVTALEQLTLLVNYCPFYAEGYNQRAFVHFLAGRYDQALPDLDEALALNPRHVGALSGKALTLFQLGREAEGQAVLREAVALNPWLGERFLLKPIPSDEL